MVVSRNYVGWYKLKTQLEKLQADKLFHAREVWWCSFGANVGFEEDGKGELFERPILIVRKFSKDLFMAVPLTTKQKDNRFHHPIKIGDIDGSVIISQARVISTKRLNRRLGKVGKKRFNEVVDKLSGLILSEKSISADFSAESPVPSGNLYINDNKHEQKSQADLKKDNEISKKGEKL